MEQQAETQATVGQDQLKILTDMVQQILRERERNAETKIQTHTLIEEDFFRTPLTEEERKIAIHSFPKTSSMNYFPPPLNDSASSVMEKDDSLLYVIQLSLAQATRKIDYYIHSRIQQTPKINTDSETEATFASITRFLLADIAATVTQAKLDNLHKVLDHPRKTTQLIESDNKPLMDQEALEVLISKPVPIQATESPIAIQVFVGRVAAAGGGLNRDPKQPCSTEHSREGIQNPLQEPPLSRSEIEVARYENLAEGRIFAGDDLYSGAASISKGVFWAPFETGGTCIWPKELTSSESPSNSTSDVPIPHQYKSRLSREAIKILTEEIESLLAKKEIEEIQPKDPGFYSQLFTITKNTGGLRYVLDLRKLNQHTISENGENEGGVCSNHTLDILQALRAWVQCQQREIVNLPIPVYHTPRHGHQYKENDPQGSVNQDQGYLTRGKKATESCEYDFEMYREIYLESPINVDCTDTMSPYASQTARTKESITVDSEIMDIESYHYETCHSEPIDSRTDLESLSGNEYQTSGRLCTAGAQSRRCAENTDCANRMFSITRGIQNTEFGLWSTRSRPVCIPPEQEGGSLLQLVPRHLVIRPECTVQKVPKRTITNNSGDTDVEVCYLVSGNISPINLAAGPSASNDDHTGSKKRKVAALGKQALALDGLEDQRRFLESQGLGTYAVDCILSNERRVRRRSSVSDIHKINDEHSQLSLGVLNLVIIVPKEKRSGRPIEKQFQISPHTDPILCPIVAYSLNKEIVATSVFPTPHANNSKWTVNRLLRFINDSSKPL
ncbi:hypothetical protein AYI70_g11672 [Smittium culicis]|uniref:Uncharacterized protein n=1 Tax=Smittium culicis TaxID=133412 RepID=A0A1R1X0U1_9FUNG|nr:hypothetical protein AYI70_g11672 [Smittium culicis]